MRLLIAFSLALSALLLAGCGKGADTNMAGGTTGSSTADESKLVGKYMAEFTLPPDKKDDPMAKMAESFVKGMMIELKADKTYTMTAMGIPIEGKWSASGDKVSLTVEKMMGMSKADAQKMNAKNPNAVQGQKAADASDKPQEYIVSDDGNTLTPADQKDASKGTMTFKKAS